MTAYDSEFFEGNDRAAKRSAAIVAPIVCELLRPTSIVDIGCGRGVWLSEFQRNGVKDVLGVDGDYVDRSSVAIAAENFLARDLNAPLRLDRRFDLAISLEVAEHLKPSCSVKFIQSLAALADVVLFSAAAPGQGGTRHLNEQWPCYWRQIFDESGLRRVDVIRPRIWNDQRVAWWYRQNIVVFATPSAINNSPELNRAYAEYAESDMEFVHRRVISAHNSFRSLCRRTVTALNHAIQRRICR